MDIDRIAEIVETVTVESRDDGNVFTETGRADVIASLLFESGYHLLFSGNLCYVFSKRNFQPGDEVVLISSHIDTVYKECFCREDGDFLTGTFDNSLTNAAVVGNMLEGVFADNVIVAFTGDEEVDSEGALEVYRTLHHAGLKVKFAVVTEVTNEGWDKECAFTVENDLGVGIFNGRKLAEVLDEYQGEFDYIHNAEPDESWDYNALNIACLTLCVPAQGDMHSEGGVFARKLLLPRYCEALCDIVGCVSEI